MSLPQHTPTAHPSPDFHSDCADAIAASWTPLLDRFAIASASLVDARSLQQRVDTKFVLPVSAVPLLLEELANDYAVVPAGSVSVASYRTLYFDTADLGFYHAHRRGRGIRHKVRLRHYPDRCVSFLEVKTRLNPVRVSKARLRRAYGDNTLSRDDLGFVRERTGLDQLLEPQVWTHFRRASLVGVETHERITIDCGLRASMGRPSTTLRNLAIVEVKQTRLARRTPVLLALRECGWRPGWASKYCIAIALTRPDVRPHRLLAALRALDGGVA